MKKEEKSLKCRTSVKPYISNSHYGTYTYILYIKLLTHGLYLITVVKGFTYIFQPHIYGLTDTIKGNFNTKYQQSSCFISDIDTLNLFPIGPINSFFQTCW